MTEFQNVWNFRDLKQWLIYVDVVANDIDFQYQISIKATNVIVQLPVFKSFIVHFP